MIISLSLLIFIWARTTTILMLMIIKLILHKHHHPEPNILIIWPFSLFSLVLFSHLSTPKINVDLIINSCINKKSNSFEDEKRTQQNQYHVVLMYQINNKKALLHKNIKKLFFYTHIISVRPLWIYCRSLRVKIMHYIVGRELINEHFEQYHLWILKKLVLFLMRSL